jgi:hypothetical protein
MGKCKPTLATVDQFMHYSVIFGPQIPGPEEEEVVAVIPN